MQTPLTIYNTKSRKKESFEPLNPPHVGLYVCGPTVYGDAHLGHARPAITFDLVFRYLKHIGYQVRYVRNITDVGHLENDADHGDDKIEKKARLEKLEPMEIAQFYTDRYLSAMDTLNVCRPSIQPLASGHIPEQIEVIQKIFDAGMAYEANGSVYFDIRKYQSETHQYGMLSGRVLEDMISSFRELDGQQEKRYPADFALWKKASPEHIMRWSSPWSEGFPGWHLECTAMSAKYLGETFDIHGGGIDLLFPHHESEIAQSVCAFGHEPVKYWMHNNMITIDGQKMGKSLGNFITLNEFFSGDHPKLDKAYSPMTIRFFILQAHYRSTLDFSNEALQASEKGLKRLMEGYKNLDRIKAAETSSVDLASIHNKCADAMNDDFNSPMVIAHLFELLHLINGALENKIAFTSEDIHEAKQMLDTWLLSVLGLTSEAEQGNTDLLDGVMKIIIDIRKQVRDNKDWATSDKLRDELAALGITMKDTKDGSTWSKS